jgi:hypothetical protein
MKKVPLTQGKVALVDDEFYDVVMEYKWCARRSKHLWYALRGKRRGDSRKPLMMHRFIAELAGWKIKDKLLDHVSGDGLDNRLKNLRVASRGQNAANSGARRNNQSGYKGVFWSKRLKMWRASIKKDRVRYHLGCYKNKEDAARAYDQASYELFGEFASFNFPNFKPEKVDPPLYLQFKRPPPSSKHKGIYKHKQTGKWQAKAPVGGKYIHIGFYPTEQEALEAQKCFLNKLKSQ